MLVNRMWSAYADTLSAMGEKDKGIKAILWINVLGQMQQHWGGENLNKLAREAKLGLATVQRIKAGKTSVGLDVVVKVAKVFRMEAYQLLCPSAYKATFSAICRAYNETDDRGKDFISAAAAALLQQERTIKTGEGDDS